MSSDFLILEFGSSASTLICLKTLERFNFHRIKQSESPLRLITFEHLDEFNQNTNDFVQTCANRPLLNLQLSPLKPWANFTGEFNYYYSGTESIREALKLVASLVNRSIKVLVVIDGPLGSIYHWARYPAIPIVLDASSGINLAIDFLLDDLIRIDEKRWRCHGRSICRH